MKSSSTFLAVFLVGSVLGLDPVQAQTTRVWTAGTGSSDFNNTNNYDPSGALGGSDLIFDKQTSAALAVSTGVSLNTLEIRSGASGFILGGEALTISHGGVVVADMTTATFNNRLTVNTGATQLTVNVGTGGTMVANNYVTPISRPFHKTGAGTLILAVGMGTEADNFLRNGTSIHIDEGVLEIGDAAKFEPGATLAALSVTLGTASSTAVLRGGGSFGGTITKPVTLTTYGVNRSILEPAGDGTLEIRNLNAASGATFKFDLGTDLIFGAGTFTGSTAASSLALDLTGGMAGVTYTLFDYGALSDVSVSDFAISNSGYVVDFWNIDTVNGLVQVQFSAVPEPSYVGIVALALGGLWVLRKRQLVA